MNVKNVTPIYFFSWSGYVKKNYSNFSYNLKCYKFDLKII